MTLQKTTWLPKARALLATAACCLSLAIAGDASAQPATMPKELEHVGVTEHLDGQLPLATKFRDHTGKDVELGQYFDGKRPVVLQFAYHSCPVVCSMITNNLAAGLKGVPWTIGKEFDVVTISIDPNESLEKTAAKRSGILAEYGRVEFNAFTIDPSKMDPPVVEGVDGKDGGVALLPGAAEQPRVEYKHDVGHISPDKAGWHFLVARSGDEKAIADVAKAAGFEYQYDERQKQWGHPSVIMIVKPNGRMARYLYGIEFNPADIRLGLLEASEGRHISTIEKLILYCYHYDPQGGKYVLVARRVMQVGGGAVAIVLFGVLGLLWARELRKPKKDAKETDRETEATSDGEGLAAASSGGAK